MTEAERVDGRSTIRSENRTRILEAARERFSAQGYRGTTTRELAEAAGVSEPTLFRHFPTKAALFDAAVVDPLATVIEDFVERHRGEPGRDTTELGIRNFFNELLADMTANSELLVAITAALAFNESDTELVAELRPRLRSLLTGLDDQFAKEFSARGFDVDPAIGLRAMFAMVLGFVMHESWLFAEDGAPGHDRLVDETTRLFSGGLGGR